MQRSLPFLYLLTLLIIGFTGGTVLFRFVNDRTDFVGFSLDLAISGELE